MAVVGYRDGPQEDDEGGADQIREASRDSVPRGGAPGRGRSGTDGRERHIFYFIRLCCSFPRIDVMIVAWLQLRKLPGR